MVNCNAGNVLNCVLPPGLDSVDHTIETSFLSHDDTPKPSCLALSRSNTRLCSSVHLDVACVNHPPPPDKTLEEIVKLMYYA
ncbi:hypothetical protein PM082_011850 [Marasmius tenuissimus]|nr:hypothetical protein PM082_011850 [Marasmius tenuissimus]